MQKVITENLFVNFVLLQCDSDTGEFKVVPKHESKYFNHNDFPTPLYAAANFDLPPEKNKLRINVLCEEKVLMIFINVTLDIHCM